MEACFFHHGGVLLGDLVHGVDGLVDRLKTRRLFRRAGADRVEHRTHLHNLRDDLAQRLRAMQLNELVIVGMKTQFCIDTTCRVAVELGFSVILPEDGHTCMDTATLSAAAIIEHHNATLAGAFVQRVSAAAISF